MSRGHAIDGEETLFDFDGLEPFEGAELPVFPVGAPAMPLELSDMSYIPHFDNLDLSSFSAASTPAEVVDSISKAQSSGVYGALGDEESLETYKGKGKSASQPMDILPRGSPDSDFDPFSSAISSGPSRGSLLSHLPSSSVSSPQTLASFGFSPVTSPHLLYGSQGATSYTTEITTPGSSYTGVERDFSDDDTDQAGAGKGKSRASPPILPPLSFSPSGFARGETNWPIEDHSSAEIAGSSHHHIFASHIELPASVASPLRPDSPPFIQRYPSRTRSFSSLSSPSVKPLLTRTKLSLAKGKRPSNLARRLLLRKYEDIECDLEPEESAPTNTPTERIGHELYASLSEPSTPCAFAIERGSTVTSDSYKEPVASADEKPVPPDLFDHMLPKEIKLRIFQTLLRLHEVDGELAMRSSSWTASKASKKEHRWTGKEKGFVELLRISSVCKSWERLVLDGQLWVNLDLQAFPQLPSYLLLRLTSSSGSFVRTINLSGHTQLSASSLLDITKSFCIRNAFSEDHLATQLTDVNFSGCTVITAYALHNILISSPLLLKLKLKGLSVVTNETCLTLATHCPAIVSLDLSRCHNMDVDGIISFIVFRRGNGSTLPLKELRVSGLKRANDRLMSLLGTYATNLEVLDLNGARELHNTALEAFVACRDTDDNSHEVLLTSREAGHDPSDPTKYRRRVTGLRHLSLSFCPLLSDRACLHLAHAVPKLEFLELAGVGSELKDEGLVQLLNTTPYLRRLDLEEACNITDVTLAALTPPIIDGQPSSPPSEPGSQLEQLNLSYAIQLTNDAILALIRACTRLKRLEVDNTRVSGTAVKEFVRLVRKRQAANAEIAIIDCRGVGENAVKDVAGSTRTRKGWRGWDARHLRYLDARDNEGLSVGTDECDESRVALKSFYSWQIVDAVEAAREKRRKANRKSGRDAKTGGEEDYFSTKRSSSKWWSPGARRASGSTSPIGWTGGDREREGCIIM
ncbi:RNI-like protein [Phellopilus nigrolimitatus]|nr:RNI-like protein [Phellopilus nigrolimitatus]